MINPVKYSVISCYMLMCAFIIKIFLFSLKRRFGAVNIDFRINPDVSCELFWCVSGYNMGFEISKTQCNTKKKQHNLKQRLY